MSPEELARFRAGDAALFRALVDRFSPRVIGVCRGFAADDDAAHDLAQETWLRVFAKRGSYRGGSFAAWLFTICRRVCLSAVRTQKRALRVEIAEPLPDASSGPSRAAMEADIRSAVSRALFSLAPRQREVVIHRLIDGLSTRETAVAMGCAEGTVKAGLHQALAKLREPLEAHAPTPPNTEMQRMGAR